MPEKSTASEMADPKQSTITTALKEREAILNRSQIMADIGSFVWDLRDDSLSWSDNMYTIHGVSRDDFSENLSDVMDRLIHPGDLPHVKAEIAKMIPDKMVRPMEFRIIRPDGVERVMRSAGEFEFDEEGVPIKVIGVHQDITERRRIEKKLREGEEIYRSLFENAQDAIFVADPETGTLIDANKRAEELTGYVRKELIGRHQTFIHPPVESDFYQEEFDKATKRKGAKFTEMLIRTKEGVDIPVEISSGGTVELANSKLHIGIFRDISDRKKAEDNLRNRNAFIETILANLPIGLAVNSISMSSLVYMNRKFEEIYGWPEEDLTDVAAFFQKVYPGQKELEERIIADIASGDPSRMQWNDLVATGKDGTRKVISAKNIPLIEQDLMISTVQDVTARHDSDLRLRESEEKFRLISEQSILSIVILGESGYLYFNDAFKELTGYSEAELNAMTYEDTMRQVHPDHRDFVTYQGIMKLNGNEDTITQYRYKGITKEGKIKWLELYSKPISWIDQKAVLITLVDITEQVRAQLDLIASEEKFRHLAEMLPETIYEMDLTGRLTFVNKAAYETFEYTEEDFEKGLYALDMIVPGDRDRSIENISRVSAGERVGVQEYTAVKKHGATFPVMMSSAPIYGNKELMGIRGFAVNLSERKELEARLRQAQKMESIGTLAGGIAHDFNNILSIILGNTELAIDDTPAWQPIREYLEEARTASLRAKDLVQQLLTFTRQSKEKLEPVNITHVFKESVRLLKSTIPANIEITASISGDIHTIHADPTQIHQILINLVSNAADAISGNGKVNIEISSISVLEKQRSLIGDLEPGDFVRISVADNGCGIRPDIREKIFDPYFTTKEIGKGTGMGLSLVQGIVESHGGHIQIDSEEDRGTVIRIYFPASHRQAEPDSVAASLLPGGTESVLIVDDENSVAVLGRKRLEKLGYKAECRTVPREALALIESNPDRFDLVITDMAMPKMTGDRLAVEIQQINPKLPVILCTGFSDRVDADRAREMGIKAYLIKPIDMADLAETVRRVLDENA